MDDVVKVLSVCSRGRTISPGCPESRRKVLGDERPPSAMTAIVVSGLVKPELLLEVDVIAEIGQ